MMKSAMATAPSVIYRVTWGAASSLIMLGATASVLSLSSGVPCQADATSDLVDSLNSVSQTATNAIAQPQPQPIPQTAQPAQYPTAPVYSGQPLTVQERLTRALNFLLSLRTLYWVGGTIAVGSLGYLIRQLMKAGERLAETDLKRFVSSYNHARLLNDEHGRGGGVFRIDYPQIRVGEWVFPLKGAVLEGTDLLHLSNGRVLQFYWDIIQNEDPNDIPVRRHFGTVQETAAQTKARMAKKKANIADRTSIFD